jgi:hypothetical protein
MRDVSRTTRILRSLLLALLLSTTLSAAAGPELDLVRWTIDGGGGMSREGTYVLRGTIGQPEAGGPFTGRPYALIGGFWGGAPQETYDVYLPLALRTYP